ncbi:manganese-dependent inorganic pyrophosphatase [Pseudorhodobacter sp.]|uniref:manganese-dependent inorganic pyrophosphatase n=1 Tax=Pseudorhodobacter sp. TaxID=1934400 RepID=UPI0026472C51|nr:manganese-dependent inorganic pyrophosphatase [Pseudorhodobacter sp.]MDN5788570.1 manganese-dependent inorganic pyrophosphatase [Pseudorhodobacter sp.]
MTILVFGHKSPDTDSTGSPIIWAWYLTEVVGTQAKPVLLGEPNTEAAFMLKHWDLPKPEIIADVTAADTCIIVDTNNPAELPPSIHEANVVGIIDHHMLVGGIMTKSPIEITIRPLACTATIMHDLIGDALTAAPRGIKGAMLSCILSDTLAFRSPTTTPKDRAVAEKLARELDVSIPDFAAALFAAKSDVSRFSDAELLRMDSKEYNVAGKDLRISVLETTAPSVLLDRKASLMAAMPGVAQEDGAEQVLLFIVDILKEEATLLVPNDLVRQMAEASFGAKVSGDSVVLPGVMSRKKQIIPALKL